MEEKNLIEHLTAFGLTRQEAFVYLELFRSGTSNGYEIAKCTGISRSYVTEGASRKYTAVDIEEFCQNKIRSLDVRKELLSIHMPREKEERAGYFTISSDANIADKIRNMLNRARKRVYLSMSASLLGEFQEELEYLTERKIKVVVLTSSIRDRKAEDREHSLQQKGVQIYHT